MPTYIRYATLVAFGVTTVTFCQTPPQGIHLKPSKESDGNNITLKAWSRKLGDEWRSVFAVRESEYTVVEKKTNGETKNVKGTIRIVLVVACKAQLGTLTRIRPSLFHVLGESRDERAISYKLTNGDVLTLRTCSEWTDDQFKLKAEGLSVKITLDSIKKGQVALAVPVKKVLVDETGRQWLLADNSTVQVFIHEP